MQTRRKRRPLVCQLSQRKESRRQQKGQQMQFGVPLASRRRRRFILFCSQRKERMGRRQQGRTHAKQKEITTRRRPEDSRSTKQESGARQGTIQTNDEPV